MSGKAVERLQAPEESPERARRRRRPRGGTPGCGGATGTSSVTSAATTRATAPMTMAHRKSPYTSLSSVPDLAQLVLGAGLLGVLHVDQHEAVEEEPELPDRGVEDQEPDQRNQPADREPARGSRSLEPCGTADSAGEDERGADEEGRLPGERRE